MLATTQNWKDIQKYYHGTFVKFRELGDIPVYIDKVTGEAIWGVLHDGEKVELQLCQEGYQLDYCIPKKTVYQVGRTAYILERVPARQWKKGLSEQNTSVSMITPSGEFSKVSMNMNNIYAFVNKPDYRDLFDLLHGYESVALNSRVYALPNGNICSDQNTLGTWDMGNKVYYHRPFEEEFRKLFFGRPYTLIGV